MRYLLLIEKVGTLPNEISLESVVQVRNQFEDSYQGGSPAVVETFATVELAVAIKVELSKLRLLTKK